MARAKHFKRSHCLVFFFRDSRLIARNYLTNADVETSALLVAVLEELGEWRTIAQIAARLPRFTQSSIRLTLTQLLQWGLIVERGSAAAKREARLSVWDTWGEEARFFHFATKHAFAGGRHADELEVNKRLLRHGAPPSSIKTTYRKAPRVRLPPCDARIDSEWPRVLLNRRTIRTFDRPSPSLADLSLLLWLTFGFTSKRPWPGLGDVPLRTSPSGGARQTIEAYIVALSGGHGGAVPLRANTLERGIYHYRPDRHELELVRPGVARQRVVRWCAGQTWIGHASVIVVLTAVLPRLMWRYPSSRAYRVLMLEAGHFCQTFCLVATWLGLAPFSTAALDDAQLESDLGLDGVSETVVYLAGVGTSRDAQRPRNESIKGSARSRSTSRVHPSRRPSR